MDASARTLFIDLDAIMPSCLIHTQEFLPAHQSQSLQHGAAIIRAPEISLTIHHFQLRGEFIPLNDLLKLLGLAPSGGAAKTLIAEGAVAVDGEIETRIRRKLRPGQVVRFADEEIRIVAADATN